MEVRTIAISGAIRAPLVALTAAQARIAQPTKHWSAHLSHWELHRKAECHDSSVQHGHCRRRWLSAEQSIPAVEGSEQQQEEREERAHAECGEGTHRAGSPDIGCGVPGQCADDHQRGAAQPIPALPVPHGIVHTSRDEPAARALCVASRRVASRRTCIWACRACDRHATPHTAPAAVNTKKRASNWEHCVQVYARARAYRVSPLEARRVGRPLATRVSPPSVDQYLGKLAVSTCCLLAGCR
jgi:hypothetical protein